ncbi:riboflavin biosynthesis protein [Roseibium aquae]|uniref:Riboflavin biosynthesis protein n=1 Tax=Roseibium aquae TaxID=1323746 RepID=A0A916X2F0_9HYPH|nr:bifunctional riboflavin kinase/FAD synthetase [Roseibium aquae]GGB52561.1 riboflavin biosynthesis protein [Roseibium aquae]
MPLAPLPGFQRIKCMADFPATLQHGVVAIGNFDGVHRGHRAVLGAALRMGKEKGLPVFALTFEPHPRSFFNPAAPVFRLTPAGQKAKVLHLCGLDGVLELAFTREFSSIEADAFVKDILLSQLKIQAAVTGYDFHFGKARGGTPEFLMQSGRTHAFDVEIVGREEDEGHQVVSSSRIRDRLAAGDVTEANALLGYRWFVETEVRHGDKRGRDLGYPTANLRLADNCPLKHGIYAVKVRVDGTLHDGVASFGRRPTFDNGAPLLEVFLFDFSGDLYGKTLTVHIVTFLRSEGKFDSAQALVAQMDRDSLEARAALGDLRPLSDLDHALLFDEEAVCP